MAASKHCANLRAKQSKLDYESDDSDFAVPETSGGNTGGLGSNGRPSTATLRSSKEGDARGQRQRPSTAGPLRAGDNQSNRRAGRPLTAGNKRNNGLQQGNNGSRSSDSNTKLPDAGRNRRSRRPASSPLVRANHSNKFDSDPGFVKGEIAGYKPPNLVFDDDALARARTLSRSDISDIFKLNTKGSSARAATTTPALEACLRVGIQPTDLLPRPVSKFTKITVGFQTLEVGKEEAYQRWSAYDEQRQKWLASVLYEKVRILQERSHAANELDDTKKYYSTSRFIATHINPANTILVLKNSRYTGVWCMVYQVYHRYLSKLKCTWKEPKPTKPLVKLKSFSGPIEQLFLIPSQDSPISGIQNIRHSTHSTAVYIYTAVQGKVYCLPIVPIFTLIKTENNKKLYFDKKYIIYFFNKL